jgi:NADH dehydrogenase
MALLPLVPVSGKGRALYQPIWAEDAADCVIACLRAPPAGQRLKRTGNADPALGASASSAPAVGNSADHRRFELAGPDTLSRDEIVRVVLRSIDRSRPLVHLPTPIVSRTLRVLQAAAGSGTLVTWDEAELMESQMISTRGAADAEGLGVTPRPMAAVLGTA